MLVFDLAQIFWHKALIYQSLGSAQDYTSLQFLKAKEIIHM